MHSLCYVFVPAEMASDPQSARTAAKNILDPYSYHEDKPHEEAFYDWYQIGGRWTGFLSPSGYEPEKDPTNLEKCTCGGQSSCYQCRGAGTRAKWPTDWAAYEGDAQPVEVVLRRILSDPPFRFLTIDGPISKSQGTQRFCVLLEETVAKHKDGMVVVVDCHS